MQTILTGYKPRVDRALSHLLVKQQHSLATVNYWGEDAIKRLIPFATSGKSIRGALVLFAYKLFKKKTPPEVIDVAAIIELFHTGLLIHDDIMDRDQIRRGNKTIYAQYQDYLEKKKVKDATHLGISLGICAGDLSFFLAFFLLNSVDISPKIYTAITKKIAHELSLVGVAQMQDLDASPRTENQILSLYKYKTARYTFSLPLAIGAILAQQTGATIKKLETLGEHIGILFQIIDDELNLFGDTALTGKPVGSDLREHKQTLHYYFAKNLLPGQIWQQLNMVISKNLTREELKNIKSIFKTYGIMDKVKEKKRELLTDIDTDIISIALTKDKKQQLAQLSSFLLTRTK